MSINPQCFIISVVGGKGGVGKSVYAANLAIAFSQELRSPTLLIDADAKTCGDQNVLLGIRANKTISDIVKSEGSLQNIGQMLVQHPSGIHFLPAVKGPEEKLNVTSEAFQKLIENLSRQYRFIIIDCGNELQDFQISILNLSTAVNIITVPEVLVINQTQRLIQDLLSATFPMDMFQLIVNKATPAGLAPQAISQALKLPVMGMIPQDDVNVFSSVQKSTPFLFSNNKSALAASYFEIVRRLSGGVLQKLKSVSKPSQISASQISSATTSSANENSPTSNATDVRNNLKLRIHNELIKAMDLKKGVTETNNDPAKEEQLRQKTLQTITQIVDRESPGTAREERSRIIKEVLEEALGLGPLEDLLKDSSVTEIMVNGYKKIFVEKSGRVQLSPITFTSNMHLRNVIERIVTPLGRRIDEKTPYVDARLKDGSRVNAVIEPLSIDGPAVTIRKFKKGGITPEKYIEYGSMTKPIIDFMKICVENGLNVVISGGTGSGKTSLLNMLSSFIPSHERVVTVEDAAELQLQQEHVVRLETRPANMEGTGAVSIRDLVKNALRMRPDRIIVGETRDGAALDMLQAMNTGHDGSMTTTHANTPRECIARLETLCLMAGMELPIRAIREQVASAVNLIVQIQRLSDGSRRITSITEVVGMQGDTVTLQEIFRFKETGFDKNRKILGAFQATGMIPTFIEKLEQKGVIIPRDLFSNEVKPLQPMSPNQPQATPNPNLMTNPALKKTGTGGRQ